MPQAEDEGRTRVYRVHEFAGLAGVTVRALHHYDRVGLLKPRRGASGYRLYARSDLDRLEQIVALKFLGLPLKQIKALLDRDPPKLSDALRVQRVVLEERRRLLDQAIAAIRQAESPASGGEPDAALLKKIIEVLEMQDEMQNDTQWAEKYYTAEARAKVEERKKLWSPELQARVEKEWGELFRDVEAALGEDPASDKAQALAARWRNLVEGFTAGDPEVSAGLNKLWTDAANWPAPARAQMQPFMNKEVWDFIQRAFAARR